MSYIKKLIAMVLTFAMTLSMASIATIQAMQSPIEFNKSKTYAVISKTNNKAIYVHNINWIQRQMVIIRNLEKYYQILFLK